MVALDPMEKALAEVNLDLNAPLDEVLERALADADLGVEMPLPVVIARISGTVSEKWLAVSEVRLGLSPENLDLTTAVNLDFEEYNRVGRSMFDKYKRQSDEPPTWFGVIPGSGDYLHAQFVFRDGTTSRVIAYSVTPLIRSSPRLTR